MENEKNADENGGVNKAIEDLGQNFTGIYCDERYCDGR